MGRKSGAYKFEKRRKELKRQKKREEKLARKMGKNSATDEDVPTATPVEEINGIHGQEEESS